MTALHKSVFRTPMSPRGTVLVVDDDPDSRTLLEMALSGAGYRVVQAADGADALMAARRARPDVILLDLAMPGMDGFAFREAQVREPALADIPVICVSGRHDAEKAARAMRLDACVCKPYSLDEIVIRVAVLTGSGESGV